MHPTCGDRRWLAAFLLLALSLLTAVPSARSELPKAEQARINDAIDKGVKYLRDHQGPAGTWATGDEKKVVGYAALPGLTLLESGVPANDPAVKKVAALVRQAAALYDGPYKLDGTYEIALSILFLDRLGDPDDKKIIQRLALRLVAGQRVTGGWHYNCPILRPEIDKELLTTLQSLPPLNVEGVPGLPDTEPVQVKIPMPFLGTFSYMAPPGQVPPGAGSQSPGSSFGESASEADRSVGDVSPALNMESVRSTRQNYCIKALETAPVPAEVTRSAKDDKPKPAAKPVVIPPRLKGMPIFNDPKKFVMVDDPNSKTDNSNTQFAILALWAAQRHDVPMDRTLRLLVKRFQVSQNPVGSWDYHFFLGGSKNESPQMTAVGLLGLAVGHGMAAPGRGAGVRRQVKDPAIVNGFVALNRWIGQPTGRMEGHQQQNLYYLWSLERVAVLYNLDRIGDKDWYRWGAEILVANQAVDGHWENGQYHGSSTVLDTCLALLFLQRANLAKDLADKLPFNPADLNTAVSDQAKKDAEKTTTARDLTEATKSPRDTEPMPVDPPIVTDPKPGTQDTMDTKPDSEKADQKPSSDQRPAAARDEPTPKRKIWPYIILGLGALLLLIAGVFLTMYLGGDSGDEEKRARPKKRLAKKNLRRSADA
jgi:hypothetical protein